MRGSVYLLRLAHLSVVAAMLPLQATAQNLLVNGDFSSDVSSGWQVLWWDTSLATLDVNDDPNSGSAYAYVGTGVAPGDFYVLAQCVSITESGLYIFGASGYAPSGQQSGLASLGGTYEVDLNTANCSGPFFARGSIYLGNAALPDQWITATSGSALKIPSPSNPAMSIKISLGIGLPMASDFGAGNFDAIYLVRDTVFAGDFD